MGFEARVGRERREKIGARTEGMVKMARNEKIFVLRT
jgi:transposase